MTMMYSNRWSAAASADYYGRVYSDEARDAVQRCVPQLNPATAEELRRFAAESGGATAGHWLRLHRATVLLAGR
ncbi:hypothetical protein ABZ770_36110 [Streptomyces sp. NPDC006654]|uniref:hypothetical protein n=1 Tax=Streptomyces sp. NPDC006654 TaxID=3156897 RepID=UPI00340B2771